MTTPDPYCVLYVEDGQEKFTFAEPYTTAYGTARRLEGEGKTVIAVVTEQYARNRHRPAKTLTAIISVVAVEGGGKLDCCDDDTHHVWVTTTCWSPRRAYLTGARPFLLVAGCEPEELVDQHFVADIPEDMPSDDDTNGERLEWPGLRLAEPIPEGWLQ